jgi:uncharacterized protein YidB (DUF937 family)
MLGHLFGPFSTSTRIAPHSHDHGLEWLQQILAAPSSQHQARRTSYGVIRRADVEQALGEERCQESGLWRQELLSGLSRELPQAVDQHNNVAGNTRQG